jgi:hypothetical protein
MSESRPLSLLSRRCSGPRRTSHWCQEQLTGVAREGGMALIPATVALQGACALRAAIAVSFNRPELPLGVLVLIPRGHAADRLNQITYVVDSDHVLRRIPYRLIACDVRFAEDVHLSIECFVFPDGLDRLAFGI